MSYRAGIGAGMAALGYTPRDPHIVCDGCGRAHQLGTRSRVVAVWFLNLKPPPKWKGTCIVDHETGIITRTDWCPSCVEKGRAP